MAEEARIFFGGRFVSSLASGHALEWTKKEGGALLYLLLAVHFGL